MIILDTNVVSALMQQQPDAQVVAWLDDQPAEAIWINAVTLFEGRYGLALLPDGQRKTLLQERFEELLTQDLQNRIAHFDTQAAKSAAALAAQSTGPPGGYARHLHSRHRLGAARDPGNAQHKAF